MKGFRAAAALNLFIVLVGAVASMVQVYVGQPNVGVKQRELCVPTVFVAVSLATVGPLLLWHWLPKPVWRKS